MSRQDLLHPSAILHKPSEGFTPPDIPGEEEPQKRVWKANFLPQATAEQVLLGCEAIMSYPIQTKEMKN